MPTLTPQQVEEAARAMPDHTLATAFLEPDARARVIALILFAHEISRVRAVVSEAGLAAIRLQWWRDTIDQIYSGQVVRAQPTAVALSATVHEANLPRHLLDAMIDGHACELDDEPFQTWADLDNYCNETSGNLARLSLLACGLPAITSNIDAVARHAAIAWGMAHLLATTPSWLGRRCLWLPQSETIGLDKDAVFAGEVNEGLLSSLRTAQVRIKNARGQTNTNLRLVKLSSYFPVLAHACLASVYAAQAMPKIGRMWNITPEVGLLKRQILVTLSVARARI